jgi:hypothetical protein
MKRREAVGGRRGWLLWALVAASGCDAPVDAPTDYESMLGYIFAHAGDVAEEEGTEPAELVAGLENLHDWLQETSQLEAAMKGYTINSLEETAVDHLDGVDRSAQDLDGVSVVTKSRHAPRDIVALLTWTRFKDVLDARTDATFERYDRTFDLDSPECFGQRTCPLLRAETDTKSYWGGFIGMEMRFTTEFRWVETKYGWMVVHRFWLVGATNGDCCDVVMHKNYYLGVLMLDGGRDGTSLPAGVVNGASGLVGGAGDRLRALETLLSEPGALRIHANWFDVDFGVFPITRERALDTIVNSTKNDSAFIDTYLSEHPDLGFTN